jgi:hypothetical protein
VEFNFTPSATAYNGMRIAWSETVGANNPYVALSEIELRVGPYYSGPLEFAYGYAGSSIYLGDTNVLAAYLGDTTVDAIYLGDVQLL